MPTYQYACTNPDGKHEFELVQSFSDAPASECPVCGSPVRKVYGSVGVVFKGSGFYRTDSRTPVGVKAGAENGSEKAPGSDKSSGSEKGSPAEKVPGSGSRSDKAPAAAGSSSSPARSAGGKVEAGAA